MQKYIYTTIFFTIAFCLSWAGKAQTYPGKIGVGVGLNQWNKPFVDIVKNARAFESISGEDLAMDEDGWPLNDAKIVLLEAWPVAEWWSSVDDPEAYHTDLSGTYKGSFKGRANISKVAGEFILGEMIYESATNLTYFEFTIPENANGFVNLAFTETQRMPESVMNSGITELKVTRPGYNHQSQQVFNDVFLNALNSACFSTIRFMGFTYTNNANPEYPERIEWNQRKPIDAATFHWTADGAYPGVPWEYVVELGNLLDKNIWVNVPVAASDDYIRELAIFIRDQLEPELKVYVEYSNEVWNWGFSQAHWNLAYAQANDLNYIEAYAKRTAEIAQIFEDVTGQDALNNRIRVINSWQIGWWPPNFQYSEQMNYINEHFGAPKDLIFGLGVAPYFNCGEVCENGSVDEIINAMELSSDLSVESRTLVKDVAEEWDLPGGMLAYEGGSDTGGGSTTNITNRIMAERSPDMKTLIQHDLKDNWFDQGGGLFMFLELTSSYSRYGSWGLTDEVAQPDRNYKFSAVRDLLGNCSLTTVKSVKEKTTFELHQNHPNPWSTSTSISYSISQRDWVKLFIYDLNGKEVAQVVNEVKGAGTHSIQLNAQFFQNGVYYYSLHVGEKKESRRFVLMK